MPAVSLRHLLAACIAGFSMAAAAPHEHGVSQGVCSLDAFSSEKAIHLLVGESAAQGKGIALTSVRSLDGGATWSEPVRVDGGNRPASGLRRGNDAQIAASGDKLIAVWQSAGTDPWGGGPMATALSADGGKTWTAGPNPADDGSTEGHNFIDIAADGRGVFHLVWLDSRAGKRGLRGATSTDSGRTWSPNRTIDAETCECCLNTLLASPQGGAWVLYRAKSPRDMATASLNGETWKKPVTVGAFGWQFNGCPEVGSGLCLLPDGSLHAAVWSGQENRTGVYHLSSHDAGATWSEPRPLGDSTARNPAAATSSSGAVAIVWNTVENDVPCIRGSISKDGGKTWRASTRLSSEKASAQHPRIVPIESGFRVFWTESQNDQSPKWASAILSDQ
jgi:hypothetical protein